MCSIMQEAEIPQENSPLKSVSPSSLQTISLSGTLRDPMTQFLALGTIRC